MHYFYFIFFSQFNIINKRFNVLITLTLAKRIIIIIIIYIVNISGKSLELSESKFEN